MRRLAFAVSLLALGCTSSPRLVTFKVESEQPATIEVAGVAVCDTTPCEIQLRCQKDPMTWTEAEWLSNTVVNAVPRAPASGTELYSQPKAVNACTVPSGKSGVLRFDLRMRAVAPVERREIIQRQ